MSTKKKIGMVLGGIIVFYLFIVTPIVMWVFSNEPDTFDVSAVTQEMSTKNGKPVVFGSHILATTIKMSDVLLGKTGGYMSNDVLFPLTVMDNIPSWELGVVEIERVVSLTLRKDFSRSQSQSVENKSLVTAQTAFNNNHAEWVFPSAESKFEEGRVALSVYMDQIADSSLPDIQFYARADNLANLLSEFSSKLGSLSQNLSASTMQGTIRENTDLANDASATQSTVTTKKKYEKTPWSQIDNVFYEARGQSWAMLHILKAVKLDFKDVLDKKNAHPSLDQIIKELEDTQKPVNSIIIMNGDGFGILANHSLVMANYISRANAAIINMVDLLKQG